MFKNIIHGYLKLFMNIIIFYIMHIGIFEYLVKFYAFIYLYFIPHITYTILLTINNNKIKMMKRNFIINTIYT